MSEYILPLEILIEQFRKLPGVGRKTAVRYAMSVLDMKENELTREKTYADVPYATILRILRSAVFARIPTVSRLYALLKTQERYSALSAYAISK